VEKRFRAGQAQKSIERAHFMLITYGYVNTPRIFYPYFISTAKIITRTRLKVPLYLHCLYCW